jgi:hypothetical protein
MVLILALSVVLSMMSRFGICSDAISEVGDTYGPYTCTKCGAEYDELKDY